jgi:hypothetical protein
MPDARRAVNKRSFRVGFVRLALLRFVYQEAYVACWSDLQRHQECSSGPECQIIAGAVLASASTLSAAAPWQRRYCRRSTGLSWSAIWIGRWCVRACTDGAARVSRHAAFALCGLSRLPTGVASSLQTALIISAGGS